MGNEIAGLIGYGQIGSSVAKNYAHKEVPLCIVDEFQGKSDSLEDCTIIHVAIPTEAIEGALPKKDALYLIHSTVSVGFCRQLYLKGYKVLHCPVEGRHPDLAAAMTFWQMPLGGPKEYKEQALMHLITIGIVPDSGFGDWEETELAKLFSTTWMGIEVAVMRHAYELAARFGVDGDKVYKNYTRKYNSLYSNGGMGADEFNPKRPVLTPMNGPLGGHCVGPNAEILDECSPSWMAQFVKDMANEYWTNPCE